MEFLIVDALYAQNLDQYYSAREERKSLPYSEQLAAMTKGSQVCAAWWLVNELNKIAGVQASAVLVNAHHLQKTWGVEAGLRYRKDDWLHDILLAQIRTTHPDVLVVFPTTVLRPNFIEEAKKICPKLQCAVAWDGVGAHSNFIAQEYDLVLSCLDHTTAFYRNLGKRAATLITGFDTSLWAELCSLKQQHDIVFVGSLRGDAVYADRFRLLLEVSRRQKIDLWLSGFPAWKPWSRMQLGLLRRLQWQRFNEIWQLGRRNRGSRFGMEMFSTLAQSRICLNQHGHTGGQSAGNRRLWEATGVGTCLLTDWQPNLHKFFKIDEEVVTYRSTEECIEKMDYLLAHEDQRQAIAAAGMRRTHRDYSTRQFAEALVHNVSGALNGINS